MLDRIESANDQDSARSAECRGPAFALDSSTEFQVRLYESQVQFVRRLIKRGLVLTLFLVLFLVPSTKISVANAADGPKSSTKSAPANNERSAIGDASSNSNSVALPDVATLASEIEKLKDLLHAQAQQIAEQNQILKAQQEMLRSEEQRTAVLQNKLRSSSAPAMTTPSDAIAAGLSISNPLASGERIDFATASSATTSESSSSAPAVLSTPSVTAQETLTEKSNLKNLGPFVLSGDIRLRGEPTFGGPADHSLQRTREEIRLRFNADARLNDEISGGFSLASGDLNNPISTNQTTNQFYTRKPFDIDRAYINYHPRSFKPLTLVGGKFAYPWYNTELTWDKDINPEGVAETLAFDFHASPLRKIALVGFELPFAETAGVSLTNKSIVQSAVYGGQLQTTWNLTNSLKFSAYSGFYNWHGADAVALAVATANAASPNDGLLTLNSNRTQNSATVTTQSGIITDGTSVFPTGVKKITAGQFASKFDLFDSIARFDIKTPQPRWPVTVLGDFVQNVHACGNVGNILPAPANSSTQTFSQSTNAPCDPRQRRAYWLEARYGREEEKGDWQFAYTRMMIQREAVLGVFNYSEIQQGSNYEEHRAEVFYQALKNVQLAFIGQFGRPLVTSSSPAPAQGIFKRLDFDVTYKF
jgi:hypothetical protein